MPKTDKLLEFMNDHSGVATSTELLGAGFSAGLIASLESKGAIVRETRGVYVTEGTMLDDFARLQLRWNRCIFSHGSALYLHGLSDRLPFQLEVTVPREYNTTNLIAQNPDIVVYRANKSNYPLGITELPSLSGAMVKVYDAERCICDLLVARKGNRVDIQLFAGALDAFFKSSKKNMKNLHDYAQALGVLNELHRYTEVME